MNGDDTDPMEGSDADRAQYLRQINDMIVQDVEERRAQRLEEFQQSRDSKAVIIGITGVGDGLINSVSDQSAA